MDAARNQGMDTKVVIIIVVAVFGCCVCGILRIGWAPPHAVKATARRLSAAVSSRSETRVQPVHTAPQDASVPRARNVLLGRNIPNESHSKAPKSHNAGKTKALGLQGMYKDPLTQWIIKVSCEGDKVWAGTPGGIGVGVLNGSTLTMQLEGKGVLSSGQVTSDCIKWHNGQVWERVFDEAKMKGHLSGKYTDSATRWTIEVSHKGTSVKTKSLGGLGTGSVTGSAIVVTFNGVTVTGRVSPDLSVIHWSNGPVWTKQALIGCSSSSSSSSDASQHV